MLDGDEARSERVSGTLSDLELAELLTTCMGDRFDLLTLRELPPVQSFFTGVPARVAASNAPLSAPVCTFPDGFGFAVGLEKAKEAPCRAALWTLFWVSPVVDCGIRLWLRAELIGSPLD